MVATTEPPWVNLSVGTLARNGTTTHTLTFSTFGSVPFTPKAGNLLLVWMFGAVTNVNATGWTEQLSPVSSAELSLFTKTAAGTPPANSSDTTIVVTHNGSNYPVHAVVMELPAGSSYSSGIGSSSATTDTFPALTGLTGGAGNERLIIAARGRAAGSTGSAGASSAWGGSWVEDADLFTAFATTDGVYLTIAHQINVVATSINPTADVTTTWLASDGAWVNSDREHIVAAFVAAPVVTTTPVSGTLDLRWNSVAQVAGTLDLRWSNRAIASGTLDLRWNSTTLVSGTVDLRWNSRAQISGSLSLPWNSRALISSTLDLRWNSLTSVVGTLGLPWNSRTLVGSTLTLPWNSLGQVSGTLDLRWNSDASLSTVSGSLDLPWNTRSLVSSSLDLRWNSRALVSGSLDLRWNSDSAVSPVSGTLDLRWNTVARLSSSIALLWNVRSQVSGTVDLRWAVRSQISGSLGLLWVSYARVAGSLILTWNSAGAPPSTDRLPSDVRAQLTDRLSAYAVPEVLRYR